MPTKRPIQDELKPVLLDDAGIKDVLDTHNARVMRGEDGKQRIHYRLENGTLYLGTGGHETVVTSDLDLHYAGNIVLEGRLWAQPREGENHPPSVIAGKNLTLSYHTHGSTRGAHLKLEAVNGDVILQNTHHEGSIAFMKAHDIDVRAGGKIVIDKVNVEYASLSAPLIVTREPRRYTPKPRAEILPHLTNVDINAVNMDLDVKCERCTVTGEAGNVAYSDQATKDNSSLTAPDVNLGGMYDRHQQVQQQQNGWQIAAQAPVTGVRIIR